MVRYAVFLRGASPQNLRMPIFADALGAAGLSKIRTVRSSGNAVFETQRQACGALEQRIEQALERLAGRRFTAFVRSASELRRIVSLAADPHPAGTKRIVVL